MTETREKMLDSTGRRAAAVTRMAALLLFVAGAAGAAGTDSPSTPGSGGPVLPTGDPGATGRGPGAQAPDQSRALQQAQQQAQAALANLCGKCAPGLMDRFTLAPPEAQLVLSAYLHGRDAGISPEQLQSQIGRGLEMLSSDPQLLNSFMQTLNAMRLASPTGSRNDMTPPIPGPVLGRMLEQDPGNGLLHKYNAMQLAERGDWRDVFGEANLSVKLNAGDPEVLYYRGAAADKLGDHEGAHRDAAAALALDPSNPMTIALYNLTEGVPSSIRLPAAGFAEGSFAGGPGAAGPAAPGAAPGREAALSGAGMPGAASGVRESSDWTRKAEAALKMKDLEAALEAARRAVALNPRNAQAYNLLATAQVLRRNYDDAVKDATRALKLVPRSVPALNTRAVAYNRLGTYGLALEDSSVAIEYDPREPRSYYNKAYAEAGLGERNGMLDALQTAARLDSAFEPKLQQALQAPQASDLVFLFNDEAYVRAGREPPVSGAPARRRRFGAILAASLSGGLLIALGLLNLAGPRRREQLSRLFRFGGRVAASADGAAASAVASAGRGPFWNCYAPVREIAKGGMGVVYEAVDQGLGRRVAVKKLLEDLRSDPQELERFLGEARTVASLHHPNIVDIYSIEDDGSDVYLVFEYVEGRTLKGELEECGRLTLNEAVPIFKGVCDAVEYAHRRGVIHRDLTSANIMITKDRVAKVMDFGVARQAKDALTKLSRTNTICGTPPFMAPEQEEGLVCKQSDIYSMGVAFYHAVTAKLPFEGTPAAALMKKLGNNYAPASDAVRGLPKAVDDLLARALDPKPETRLQSAGEFRDLLEGLSAVGGSNTPQKAG